MSAKFIDQIDTSNPCAARIQCPCGGHQAEDRQQQRQSGGDERPEREHEDRERDRPREQLRTRRR
jgi:hypothetical protein